MNRSEFEGIGEDLTPIPGVMSKPKVPFEMWITLQAFRNEICHFHRLLFEGNTSNIDYISIQIARGRAAVAISPAQGAESADDV